MNHFRKTFASVMLRKMQEAGNMTLAQLAERTGITETSLWRIRSQKVTPSRESVSAISAALGITPRDLLMTRPESVNLTATGVRLVPILGEVFAGTPSQPLDSVRVPSHEWRMDGLEEDGTDSGVYISEAMYDDACRTPNPLVCAVIVTGSSMAPYYEPNDVVLVEKSEDVGLLHEGDHVVVDLTGCGEYTLKVYSPKNRGLTSIAQGPAFAFFFQEDYPEMKLWGRAIGLLRTRP